MIARSAVLAAGDALLPIDRDGDRPVFNEAWEAQAFAMVVALHEAKLFSWSEWTSALSREIAAASPANDREAGDSYYRHWLAALESLVVEKGAASRAALALRKAAWARAAEATPHGRPILLANDPQAAPNGEGRKSHWERVYATRAETEVSWFEADPAPSLEALTRVGANRRSAVIDVGGGASRLVDRLIHDGYEDVTVLDISVAAIAAARARLGEAGRKVHWLVADATAWTPDRRYDVWHDRAAFHFLTDPADEAAYVERLAHALRPGGHAIIATFAPDGPERCSGLPVARHDGQSLAAVLGPTFRLVETRRRDHLTPSGAVQRFQFSIFRRV